MGESSRTHEWHHKPLKYIAEVFLSRSEVLRRASFRPIKTSRVLKRDRKDGARDDHCTCTHFAKEKSLGVRGVKPSARVHNGIFRHKTDGAGDHLALLVSGGGVARCGSRVSHHLTPALLLLVLLD